MLVENDLLDNISMSYFNLLKPCQVTCKLTINIYTIWYHMFFFYHTLYNVNWKLRSVPIFKRVLLYIFDTPDLGLAVSVPLPIVTGIFVLLWFQSRLT